MLKRVLAFVVVVSALVAVLFLSQMQIGPPKVSGFIEGDEIRLGSRVGGRVARVAAKEGAEVEKGAVLVELEPFNLLELRAQGEAELAAARADLDRLKAGFREEEIAQAKARRDQAAARLEALTNGPRAQEIAAARADLQLAEAQLALARSEYDRTKSLADRAIASPEELDQASSGLKIAEASAAARREALGLLEAGTRPEEIAEARARLDEADQAWTLMTRGYRKEEIARAEAAANAAAAAIENVARQMDELAIRAPSDGVVESIDLQPGELVGANTPVISMMDAHEIWVRAYVPENRLSIKAGQELGLTVDGFPGEKFRGRVGFVSRQAEFTPGNVQTPEERSKQVFRIKVVLLEGHDRLRPGMIADVWLEGPGMAVAP